MFVASLVCLWVRPFLCLCDELFLLFFFEFGYMLGCLLACLNCLVLFVCWATCVIVGLSVSLFVFAGSFIFVSAAFTFACFFICVCRFVCLCFRSFYSRLFVRFFGWLVIGCLVAWLIG